MASGKKTTFQELRRAMREKAYGDVAVLKSELGGGGSLRPGLQEELEAMGELPSVDVERLSALPRGTIGREYTEFLAANELDPFRLSGKLDPALVRRNMFAARYGLVHDLYHVLTGFDTSLAGELGVWAFVAAQRYAFAHRFAVMLACLFYPIVAPWQIPRLWRNYWLGKRMGKAARTLLTVKFESMWERPVAELRRELSIDAASELNAQIVSAPA